MSAAVRAVSLARCGEGLTLILAPARVLRLVGAREDTPSRWWVRALGARTALQSALTAVRPDRFATEAGAAVDGLHGLTALGLAGLDAKHRRGALVNAAWASGWVAAMLALSRTA